MSLLTLIADEIVSIGLALIDYKLVSLLTLIADEIVPIGLALIDYKLVSALTLIADEIVSGLTLIRLSCAWIDTVLDKVLRVRHLLHTYVYKVYIY